MTKLKKSSKPSKKSPLPIWLHLGCGSDYKPNWINIDQETQYLIDKKIDLAKPSWPFKTNSVDKILANHVLEHVTDWRAFMKEVYRILKPGGLAEIAIPHGSRTWCNPYHKTSFGINTMYYWNKFHPNFQFVILSEKLNYSGCWKLAPLNILFTFLANFGGIITRKICDRFWIYLVGGFEEIRYILKKPNNS